MYLIINKVVFNALNLKVNPIIHFTEKNLVEIYDKTRSQYRGNQIFELIYNKAEHDKWFEENKSHNDFDENHFSTFKYEFTGIKDGYYFYINDNNYIMVSKLYPTEQEAEAARDELLIRANKLIAKLYKVEI